MRTARAKAILLICVLAANLALAAGPGAEGVYACSCGLVPMERRLGSSEAVFAGEVVSAEADEVAPGKGLRSLGRVEFNVEESWKGVSGRSAVVYGQGDSAMCGLDFKEGNSYLVYAGRTTDSPDYLYTGLCHATRPLVNAEKDLEMLGPPTSTLPDTGGPELVQAPGPRTETMVAVLMLLALASVLMVRGRGRA